MKRAVILGLTVVMIGCTFAAKLSTSKAKELLFADLEGGGAGTFLKPVSANLVVQPIEEGASASTSGTIQMQALQNTYTVLGTLQLPENRTITEIQPLLKVGDTKTINATGSFIHTDGGWQLSGPAEYNIRMEDIGVPLAAVNNAVDMSSAKGKKLPALLAQYNQEVDLLDQSNRRLDRLKMFYDDTIGPQGESLWAYGVWENELQDLFPDEPGLAGRLAATLHGAQTSPFERYQARKGILEPIFARNLKAVSAARDAAKSQADTIGSELRGYGT
jgi:hypothetical protein